MAEKTWDQVTLSRRKFIERALIVGVGGCFAGSFISLLAGRSESANVEQPSAAPIPPTSPTPDAKASEKIAVYVDPAAIDDLAKIWTAGRAIIDPVPTVTPTPIGKKLEKDKTPVPDEKQTRANKLNEILYRERAKELLEFVTAIKPEIAKVKPRLAAVARFTNVGAAVPPLADQNIRDQPEDSSKLPKDHFVSGHFGPQEQKNLAHNRLTKLNMGLILALAMGEYESDSRPFSRLFSENWQDRWDWVNAHLGRDTLRFYTGVTDSQQFMYGSDSRGGVLPTEETLYSGKVADKLLVMFSPTIMTLRGYKTTKTDKITDFAAVDVKGKPDWELVGHWNSNQFLQAKFRQIYDGLVEFCQKHPEFKWLVEESIV